MIRVEGGIVFGSSILTVNIKGQFLSMSKINHEEKTQILVRFAVFLYCTITLFKIKIKFDVSGLLQKIPDF